MKEYKFEVGPTKEIQTKLNQWRHDYSIEIINMVYMMSAVGEHFFCVLLTRERKGGK